MKRRPGSTCGADVPVFTGTGTGTGTGAEGGREQALEAPSLALPALFATEYALREAADVMGHRRRTR